MLLSVKSIGQTDNVIQMKHSGFLSVCGNWTYNADSALYIGYVELHPQEKRSTNYLFTLTGPMIRVVNLKYDSSYLSPVLDGRYITYHLNGEIDTVGYYKDNLRISTWKICNDSGEVIREINYQNGIIKDSVAFRKPQPLFDSKEDKTIIQPEYTDGGKNGWIKYLAQNCTPGPRYNNLLSQFKDDTAKKFQIIAFTVSDSGDVQDVFLIKSVEYSLDKQFIDIVEGSGGKWRAAKKDGKNVNFSFLQRMIVSVE